MVYIKSIAMTGFKSYGKGTVELTFNPGFTGIIGPNGSGKSNVVDAVSFTLGELSSKSMRARDLSDLIYSGTGGDGPADKAIVTITFSNEDRKIPLPHDEVVVQREVKRKGGGSVYRLNGKRSTRGEIMDKLRIANIDVREGFNLVLQGRIAELTNMTSEDRREMIEDLAGTKDFDEKRIKAISELENAEIKMGEFQVLISEAEAVVKRLAKEKKGVEEWEKIVEKIFYNKTRLYSYRHKKYMDALKDIQDKITAHSAQIKEIEENEIKVKQKELEELQRSIMGVTQEIKSKESQLEKLQAEITDKVSNITGIKRDIAHRQRRNSEMEKEIKNITHKITEIKEMQERTQKEIESIEKKIQEITVKKKEKVEEQARLNALIKKSESQYRSLQQKASELQEQIENYKKKLNSIGLQQSMKESNIEIKSGQLAMKKSELEARKRALNNIENEISSIKNEISQSQELLEVAEQRVKDSVLKKEDYERRLDEISARRSELQRQVSGMEARIETLESFLDESSNPVVEKIKELKKSGEIKGIIGRFGDLISFEDLTEEEKHAVMPFLNTIIVESTLTAQECIQYLRENQIGYGTFIPLEELSEIALEKEVSHNFISKLDKKLQKPLSIIFQNVQTAESLRDAINKFIQNIENDVLGIEFYTPEGDKITSQGLISGGASSESNEMLIAELRQKLQEYQAQLDTINKEFEMDKMKHRRLIELVTEVNKKTENVRQNIRNKEERLADLEKRKKDDAFFIEKTAREVASLETELEATTMLVKNLQAEGDEVSAKLQEVQQEHLEVTAEMEKINYNKLLDEVRKVEKILSGLEILLSKHEATKNEKEHQINVIFADQIKDNEMKINNLQRAIKSFTEEIEKLTKEKAKLENAVEELRIKESQLKEEIEKLQESISSKNAEIDAKRAEIGTLRRKIGRITQEISDLKVKQEGIRTKLTETQQRIEEEDIDIIEVEGKLDERKIENEIRDLTEKKRSLEPINALAIKQYYEAENRLKELNEKKAALDEERKIIVDFINKIEYEKTNVFLEIFNKINREFNRMFNMIAGGKAWLELENPEKPFEGGVTINAQPHGKKVKSIQSMSGGEKSLTALALIFAMQKVDPSPFYLFDEIDAALDVMNVRNVAKVIEKMSKECQCIMITHRDIAMRYANQLYGVTNVKGVSKVISVELSDEGTLKALASE
ncbi:MAG: chromosome segregation protein SMC [Candidatus Helarchaeales archaeon]